MHHAPALALCAVLVLAAAPAAAQHREARAALKRDCGACHAVDKRDRSRDPAAPAFRTLGQKYDVEGLAEALAEGISVGHPEMPEVSYPPQMIDKIIAYLKSLQPLRPEVETRKGGPR